MGFYAPKNRTLQYNSKRNQLHPFPRTAVFVQQLCINTAQKCNLQVVLLKKYGAFPPVSTGVPAVVSTRGEFLHGAARREFLHDAVRSYQPMHVECILNSLLE